VFELPATFVASPAVDNRTTVTDHDPVVAKTITEVTPPEVTAGASISTVAGAAAVVLDPGLSISDPQSSTLAGATISFGAGFVAGDVLSVGAPQAGITSSYNAGRGVLTLSGAANLGAYQAALDSVMFASANAPNPSNRTITWSVTDGTNPPAQATSSVAVFAGNPDLDIRLQNTKGGIALWQASGATTPTLSAAALLGADPGPTWFAKGSGGFFSGASDASDILLQNANGSVAVWHMQGATLLSGDVVANPGPPGTWIALAISTRRQDRHRAAKRQWQCRRLGDQRQSGLDQPVWSDRQPWRRLACRGHRRFQQRR
jgi:hypothetical protein